MNKQARQGDVYLIRVDKLPKNAKPVKREGGRVVLAHGEATGHTHSFGSRAVNMYACETERFITLAKPAYLKHQEHSPIHVEKGVYRVVRQREYQEGRIVQVAD